MGIRTQRVSGYIAYGRRDPNPPLSLFFTYPMKGTHSQLGEQKEFLQSMVLDELEAATFSTTIKPFSYDACPL